MRALALGLCLFFLCLVPAALPQDQDLDPLWLKRAEWYFYRDGFTEAARIYRTLIKKHPRNYLPYVKLAFCYRKIGLNEDALHYLLAAKKLNPSAPYMDYLIANTYQRMGAASLRMGLPEAAEKYFIKGVRANPEYWANYFRLGEIYFHRSEFRTAAEWFKPAAEKNPLHFRARMYLGLSYLKGGLLDEAAKELQHCIRIYPGCMPAHFNLGLIYARKGLWAEAWREFHLAVTKGAPVSAFKPRTL